MQQQNPDPPAMNMAVVDRNVAMEVRIITKHVAYTNIDEINL
jgi:hypothetical protein